MSRRGELSRSERWGKQIQGRKSKPGEEGREQTHIRLMTDLTEGRFSASRIHELKHFLIAWMEGGPSKAYSIYVCATTYCYQPGLLTYLLY
jgi:hypothetical protein